MLKWVSHQVVTTTAMLALTGNPFFAVLTGGLSPLPDKIDFLCGGLGRMPFHLFHHRQHSHYWLYWFLLAMFSYSYMVQRGLLLGRFSAYGGVTLFFLQGNAENALEFLLPNLLFWASIASLFHIAEDFFSGMGVPLIFPTKISPHIQLYKGGGPSECLVAALAAIAFLSLYVNPTPFQETMWKIFFVHFH